MDAADFAKLVLFSNCGTTGLGGFPPIDFNVPESRLPAELSIVPPSPPADIPRPMAAKSMLEATLLVLKGPWPSSSSELSPKPSLLPNALVMMPEIVGVPLPLRDTLPEGRAVLRLASAGWWPPLEEAPLLRSCGFGLGGSASLVCLPWPHEPETDFDHDIAWDLVEPGLMSPLPPNVELLPRRAGEND